PEVDEVRKLEVLLQLFLGNAEPVDELARRNHGVAPVSARGEEIGQERLKDGEALGHDRPCRPFAQAVHANGGRLARELRRLAFVTLAHPGQALLDDAPKLIRLERHGAAVLPKNPRRELLEARVVRDEDVALQTPPLAVPTLHPPRRAGPAPDPPPPAPAAA